MLSRRNVLLLCSFVLLAACGSGEGINARLDASHGYDVNFKASVIKALDKTSDQQREVFLAAIEALPPAHFLARYGKEPTVKEVTLGELDRYIAKTTEKVEHLQADSDIPRIQQKTSAAERELDKVTGSVTSIIQKDFDPSDCENSGCIKYAIHVKINNPNGIKFTRLPCIVEVMLQNTSSFTTLEIANCGGNDKGEYVFEVSDMKTISYINAITKVSFIRSEAKHRFENAEEPFIPRSDKIVILNQEKERLAAAQASRKIF